MSEPASKDVLALHLSHCAAAHARCSETHEAIAKMALQVGEIHARLSPKPAGEEERPHRWLPFLVIALALAVVATMNPAAAGQLIKALTH